MSKYSIVEYFLVKYKLFKYYYRNNHLTIFYKIVHIENDINAYV